MKFATLLSIAVLGASTGVAFPLFGGQGALHQRGVHTPVRRTEIPSPTATATEESVSLTETESATATAEPTETSSVEPTNTYLYSTITATDSLSAEPTTITETETGTEPVETATITETLAPEATEGVSPDLGNVGGVGGAPIIVRLRETVIIRQKIIVQRPVFVAVQVNLQVLKKVVVNQFQLNFQNRFDQWDINVVQQLSLIIAQHFEVLSRAGNRGFDQLDGGRFNSFVNKFVQHFQVFQVIRLQDVLQFVKVLQVLDVNQLASFFGRSDVLFSQRVFDQFGINNDFGIFVQKLQQLVVAVQFDAFNDDGIFDLNDALLVNGDLFRTIGK